MATAFAFVSSSKWFRLAQSQLAVANSAVTDIRVSSRRFRLVISTNEITIARMLSRGPNGILRASAFGRNFRRRIRAAQTPAYKTIMEAELSVNTRRKLPL